MRTLFLFLTLQILNTHVFAQVINTIAGTGDSGYNGDSMFANAAELSEPSGLWLNDAGEIFFTDLNNNRIRLIGTDGIITTIAGNGEAGYNSDHIPASATELNRPNGICLDEDGDIYVADWYNNRIRKIDKTTGVIITVAGTGAYGYNLDGVPAILTKLASPADVITDTEGNIFFADHDNNRIREVVASSGIIITVAGNGTFAYTGDGGLAKHAALAQPTGICFDATGDLIIVDHGNAVIRRVNSAGIITTIAGNNIAAFSGDGGQALDASLDHPTSACYDANGDLFIADQGNNRIRKVDHNTGVITTVAGNGLAAFGGDGGNPLLAELNAPWDIAFDTSGALYITDLGNNRIRKISWGVPSASQNISIQQDPLKIYPDPATDLIFIDVPPTALPGELVVSDISGKIFSWQSVGTDVSAIDITGMSDGLNFVTIISANGACNRGTFIKLTN